MIVPVENITYFLQYWPDCTNSRDSPSTGIRSLSSCGLMVQREIWPRPLHSHWMETASGWMSDFFLWILGFSWARPIKVWASLRPVVTYISCRAFKYEQEFTSWTRWRAVLSFLSEERNGPLSILGFMSDWTSLGHVNGGSLRLFGLGLGKVPSMNAVTVVAKRNAVGTWVAGHAAEPWASSAQTWMMLSWPTMLCIPGEAHFQSWSSFAPSPHPLPLPQAVIWLFT